MPLDPITTLGVRLKRPIPKGQARLNWLNTDKGYTEALKALREEGYSEAWLSRAMYDLSYGEIRLPFRISSPAEADAAFKEVNE